MTKATWVMTAPVISTAHMPGSDPFALWDEGAYDITDGFLVFIGEGDFEGDDAWLNPISEWLQENHPQCEWVRFSGDANTIPELQTWEHE